MKSYYILFLETNKKLAANNTKEEWANLQSEDDLHWLCPLAFPTLHYPQRCVPGHYGVLNSFDHTLVSIYDLHLESSVIWL